MRALRSRIPRAFASHLTAEGVRYGQYCRATLKRLGSLPASAMPTLKAAGLCVVELDRESAALERALSRRRMREANRTRRRMTILRTQLVALERRLEELAAQEPSDLGRLLAMRARSGA